MATFRGGRKRSSDLLQPSVGGIKFSRRLHSSRGCWPGNGSAHCWAHHCLDSSVSTETVWQGTSMCESGFSSALLSSREEFHSLGIPCLTNVVTWTAGSLWLSESRVFGHTRYVCPLTDRQWFILLASVTTLWQTSALLASESL